VRDGKLYVDMSALALSYPVQLYDAVDTSSTDNADNQLLKASPDTNDGTNTGMITDGYNIYSVHSLIKFTLPLDIGTITTVKLFLYEYSSVGPAAYNG
jgi:hypothetical protein